MRDFYWQDEDHQGARCAVLYGKEGPLIRVGGGYPYRPTKANEAFIAYQKPFWEAEYTEYYAKGLPNMFDKEFDWPERGLGGMRAEFDAAHAKWAEEYCDAARANYKECRDHTGKAWDAAD